MSVLAGVRVGGKASEVSSPKKPDPYLVNHSNRGHIDAGRIVHAVGAELAGGIAIAGWIAAAVCSVADCCSYVQCRLPIIQVNIINNAIGLSVHQDVTQPAIQIQEKTRHRKTRPGIKHMHIVSLKPGWK